MVTRSFREIPIPTPAPSVAPVSSSDLSKTHYMINQLQINTSQALKPVLSNPLVTNGKTLSDVALFAGMPNTVNHLLGQTLQGWTFSRPQSFCVLWEDANQPNLSSQIVLWTYIDTITDLLVW
jgi:hypothetical protein